MTILLVLILLAVLFALALMGRANHPKLPKLRQFAYAHRGLHCESVPENSMAAFRRALEKGYGIELDVHLLADGGLAVFHDSKLQRITGREGFVEDLTVADLDDYHLLGTDQTIPQFRQVLELFTGKAPLIVELKSERGNYAALCAAACKLLDEYDVDYCIESFDPRCVLWLRKNRPDIVRGQLAQNFLRDKNSNLSWILRFVLTNLLMNFMTQPDFVAYHFPDRKDLAPRLTEKLWGIQGVSWTLRSKEDFDAAVAEGKIPIFERFEP